MWSCLVDQNRTGTSSLSKLSQPILEPTTKRKECKYSKRRGDKRMSDWYEGYKKIWDMEPFDEAEVEDIYFEEVEEYEE